MGRTHKDILGNCLDALEPEYEGQSARIRLLRSYLDMKVHIIWVLLYPDDACTPRAGLNPPVSTLNLNRLTNYGTADSNEAGLDPTTTILKRHWSASQAPVATITLRLSTAAPHLCTEQSRQLRLHVRLVYVAERKLSLSMKQASYSHTPSHTATAHGKGNCPLGQAVTMRLGVSISPTKNTH
eukprot:2396488-Pleurochrysis_carterae.AAC.1